MASASSRTLWALHSSTPFLQLETTYSITAVISMSTTKACLESTSFSRTWSPRRGDPKPTRRFTSLYFAAHYSHRPLCDLRSLGMRAGRVPVSLGDGDHAACGTRKIKLD